MAYALLGSVAEVILRCLSLVAGYVSNSSTFPQPLSEDEEARYLARLQTGDDEARGILIERNLRLVAHIVNALCSNLQSERAAGHARQPFRYAVKSTTGRSDSPRSAPCHCHAA